MEELTATGSRRSELGPRQRDFQFCLTPHTNKRAGSQRFTGSMFGTPHVSEKLIYSIRQLGQIQRLGQVANRAFVKRLLD
jgi:hypothetical protein